MVYVVETSGKFSVYNFKLGNTGTRNNKLHSRLLSGFINYTIMVLICNWHKWILTYVPEIKLGIKIEVTFQLAEIFIMRLLVW